MHATNFGSLCNLLLCPSLRRLSFSLKLRSMASLNPSNPSMREQSLPGRASPSSALLYDRLETCYKKISAYETHAESKREAMTEDYMASDPALQAVSKLTEELYSEEAYRCSDALYSFLDSLEVESASPFSTVSDASEFRAFQENKALAAPSKMLANSDISAIKRYVLSKRTQASLAAVQDKAEKNVRRAFIQAVLPTHSEAVAIGAAFDDKRREICDAFKACLAASDHEPIRAVLSESRSIPEGGVLWKFRVASHNVQERCEHGIATFACHLPFLNGEAKGSHAKFMALMLQDQVTAEHQRQTASFVVRELIEEGTSDAVVLQEMSPKSLAAIQKLCNDACLTEQPLYFHASKSGKKLGVAYERGTECAALTCIVSAQPFEILEDVVVETQQATCTNFRHNALAYFPGAEVALCSTHVRHGPGPPGSASLKQNKTNIAATLTAIAATHRSDILDSESKTKGVMVVGDFNGGPWQDATPIDETYLDASRSKHLKLLACHPKEATAHVGRRSVSIDGAMFLFWPPLPLYLLP